MSLTELFQAALANPVFAGIAGGAGLSAVLYQLRAAPRQIWGAIRYNFTVTTMLRGDEQIFDDMALLLSRTESVKRARTLGMTEHYDYDQERWQWAVTFGNGHHLLRECGRFYLLHRTRPTEGGALGLGPSKAQETLAITTIGRSQCAARELIDRARTVHDGDGTVRVYLWNGGGYVLADRKRKRDLSTVFLPAAVKAALLEDLDRFRASRAHYAARGTPWRRGYLFEGPPGTGESSLVFALASYLDRPIYVINLANVGGDNGLQAAFNLAGADGVVLIEDADAVKITNEREDAPPEPIGVPGPGPGQPAPLTLSGLLNAIDGVAAREGRILFITSNHPDKLDRALLRAGRIDVRQHIGLIAEAEARAMVAAFYPDRSDAWFATHVAPQLPMSPAELQNRLIRDDAEPVLEAVA